MDLHDYLRILLKRWKLITTSTLLLLVAAAGVTMALTPMYEARAQLFVSADGADSDISQLAQGGTFTQQRVKSYAEMVTSPLVLGPVIDQLELDTTSDELALAVSAGAPINTVLIDVSVRDASAARAAQIANAVSDEFTDVIDRLERPTATGDSPVKVSVVRPAAAPEAPVSPNLPVNLAVGLLAGLLLGVGLSVLLETLDTSVRRPEDLEALDAPSLIGAIVFDSGAPEDPIAIGDDHSLRGEAFRQLRTNLQFLDIDAPPRSFVVTSSVPGEGKTTTTCNLALALAQAGHSVVLVEGDLRRPAVAKTLGLEQGAGLTTALIGQADIEDLLQPWGRTSLQVLTSGPTPPNPSEMLGSQQMRDLVTSLQATFDYVVIDAPPMLPVTDAALLSKAVDGVIVVVRSGKTRREQLRRALDLLAAVEARVLGSVLNMVPSKGHDSYSYGYYYEYSSTGERDRSHSRGNRPVQQRPSHTAEAAQAGRERIRS